MAFTLEHLVDGHVLAISNYDMQRMLLKRQLMFLFFTCLLLQKVAMQLTSGQLNQLASTVFLKLVRRLSTS